MADTTITIPDLGSLTSGQVSDLLLVTRGTTGYKMLVSDIAKTIIETYAGSSLAGSAQSVKSALDSLNSRFATNSITVSTLNDIPVNTFGYVLVDNADENPLGNNTALLAYACFGVNNRRTLIGGFTASNSTRVFINLGHLTSGQTTMTWRGWKELAFKD